MVYSVSVPNLKCLASPSRNLGNKSMLLSTNCAIVPLHDSIMFVVFYVVVTDVHMCRVQMIEYVPVLLFK